MDHEESQIPKEDHQEVDDFGEDCPHCVVEWNRYLETGIGNLDVMTDGGIRHRWWICPRCGKSHYIWNDDMA